MTAPHTPPAAPDLAAIEARAAAATPGPWRADHDFGHVNASALGPSHIVCGLDSELCADTGGADIAFIAHAREDVPALLRHLAAQQAAHAAALDAAVAEERERHAAEVAAARAEALREFAHRAEQGAVDTARIDRALATIDALTRERDRLAADLARLRAPLTGALAAIEARAVAATPDAVTYSYEGLTRGENPRHRFSICNGTWEDEPTRPHRCIAMVYSDSEDSAPDADFYANARRDVFMLLAHVRRLTAALADSDARVASAVAAARDDERERAASVAESHAIDCDLDAEDERTNGTLGGCTVAQDRAKLARMIRDGIRKPACTICEEPATCFGSSEGDPPSYHCDDCCGHGGEDGHCEPVGADAIATTPATGGAQ